jgi:hypothetical protein
MIPSAMIRSIPLCVLLLGACGNETERRSDTNVHAPTNSGAMTAEAATASKTADAPAKMAPTPATVIKDTELKEKPFVDAKTIKRLPARTPVAIVDRSGGWVRVTSGGQQGWVRLLHVSSQPSAQGGSSAQELEAAAKIATGRAGSGNIVSTTGIRGLNEEQLSKAQPNPAELKRLESYGISKEQAAAYARANKLERRQIPYPPAPG